MSKGRLLYSSISTIPRFLHGPAAIKRSTLQFYSTQWSIRTTNSAWTGQAVWAAQTTVLERVKQMSSATFLSDLTSIVGEIFLPATRKLSLSSSSHQTFKPLGSDLGQNQSIKIFLLLLCQTVCVWTTVAWAALTHTAASTVEFLLSNRSRLGGTVVLVEQQSQQQCLDQGIVVVFMVLALARPWGEAEMTHVESSCMVDVQRAYEG